MSEYLRQYVKAMGLDGPERDYAWTITADYLDGPESSDIGIEGPSHATEATLAAARKGGKGTATFYLYDDDGERYYAGRIAGDFDGPEPLDDFGEGWAGCTEVRYPGHPEYNCP